VTIELRRLKVSLEVSMGRSIHLPHVPKQLEKEYEQLKVWLGGAGGGRPPRDRMRDAVAAFQQTGILDSLGDARLVCFGAVERFAEAQPCLIEDQGAFPRLLAEVDRFSVDPRAFRRCYRGLLHGYFVYDPDAGGRHGRRNWQQLRGYLGGRLDRIRAEGTQPEWVDMILAHRNLVSEDPVTRYGASMLRGNSTEFEGVRSTLEIDSSSWVIRQLVLARVKAATQQSDEHFKPFVSGLLEMLEGYPLQKDEGLAMLLERYASLSSVVEHVDLRDCSVGVWGNPSLAMNEPRWSRVKPATRTMVRNWLNLNLIRQFFSVLAEDRNTDQRRVRFWEKYHTLIDDIYFALGPRAASSRLADIRRLREQMGNRLLTLSRPGKPTNNAFVMRMGSYLVVEFGVTGNACQVFRADQLPFALAGEVAGDGTGLKHPSRSHWLPHRDSGSETWEEEFRRVLAGLGIRPSRDAYERGGEASGQIGLRVAHEFSWVALRRFADAHGLEIEDLSRRGGRLWVSGASAPEYGPLTNQLVGWGFRWANHRAAWYRVE
jgi:hypothetical protein